MQMQLEATSHGSQPSEALVEHLERRANFAFELGSSTVLFVNLREQTAADARITVIDALAELQFSAARLLTVTGEPLSR